jgi:hypothetical protein
MNRRGKRIAFTVAARGLAMVLAVGIFYRRVVLDHIQEWQFQLTQETRTIEPEPALQGDAFLLAEPPVGLPLISFLEILANYSGWPVIHAPEEGNSETELLARAERVTADIARMTLESSGYRVLEQRFPRKAYVVIRDNP